MTNVKKINEQSLGEEIGNAISHGIGALLAIVGTTVLIVFASLYSDIWGLVSSIIFGLSLIVLYSMSTIYHALTIKKAKNIFRIFDHSSIFLLILGTYTPFCLIALRGLNGWLLLGFNAIIALIGITLNALDLKRWNKASLIGYLLMGWSSAFVIKPLITALGTGGITLLLLGGLSYTLGVVFYTRKKTPYMHFIWHFFVLAGSILHYFCILLYIIL
ncbi:MAG: hemolysin III family protein [Clostridia bacterium]